MVATRKWTVEELEASPPPGAWELIDGEIIEMTPSGFDSAMAAGTVAALVGAFVLANRLGAVFGSEAGYQPFPDQQTLRAPDFSYIRADRVETVANRRGFATIPPDFAVEVLSPSDSRTAAFAKCVWWLEAGVPLVWLADPERRSVTVWTPDEAPRTLHPG
ncbi:MAG: Uma2 family endonuclease, partial [Chloroflexota bacterium]